MEEFIRIKNARIHNLKGVDVTIPKHKLTVITGVSGSGKSSLAFDTLYEEGKRRYLMFSGTQFMVEAVPTFDKITGLSPTVAVEQRMIRQSNPRSTVGTRVKLSSLLAALFANYGVCDTEYDQGIAPEAAIFLKNSPKGVCVKCLGKGVIDKIDEEMLFGDRSQVLCDLVLSLGRHGKTREQLDSFCRRNGFQLFETKLSELSEEQYEWLLYGEPGDSGFMGYLPWIKVITDNTFSTSGRLQSMLLEQGSLKHCPCPKCMGSGRNSQAAHTTVCGKTLSELEELYISDLYAFFREAGLQNPLAKEIETKLSCMMDVGLHHLSLNRPIPTLSGGEIQRLFLAGYLIAEMDSIIFVFDEPTIGLHEVEKENLIRIIRKLVTAGNTVVAVEHDENFMREADYIIDIGPDAGVNGGRKVFEGTFSEFLHCNGSRTAPYLTKEIGFPIKKDFRSTEKEKKLILSGAKLHNLKNVTVGFPLHVMIGVAGVSGSGKSSLISDTLVPKLREQLKSKLTTGEEGQEEEEDILDKEEPLSGCTLTGAENLRHCYVIDQRPIGRSKTSCPATYTGIFDRMRVLFSETETAKKRSYKPGMFSVNSIGGCKKCKGYGNIQYYTGFGNTLEVPCEDCGGTGYRKEALEVTIGGKNIVDLLKLSVSEAKELFEGKDKAIYDMLNILEQVGLGYLTLGQKTPTISGGESQRIKLAKELAKGKNAKNALYILDEPTTGLSFSDSEKLMKLLNELVEKGNTVIITEHDPYVLSNCDYILEMGPGGGNSGGELISEGAPWVLKKNPASMIGKYLKNL